MVGIARDETNRAANAVGVYRPSGVQIPEPPQGVTDRTAGVVPTELWR